MLTFRQLKIAYSWKCNAQCGHCAVGAGPRQQKVLTREHVLTAIDDAARCSLTSIEFTGGEMFLFFRDLLDFTARARARGLRVIVDTNGFWAKSPDVARRRLFELRQHGLCMIALSTDRYHQPFIPLARVVNALEAARELELATSVTICSERRDDSLLETIAALQGRTSNFQVQTVAPFGRGAELPREQLVRCPYSQASAPCKALLAPTVNPDGRVTLCCAPPMYLSEELAQLSPLVLGYLDREPLIEILRRAQRNRFLSLLAAEGLAGIVDRLNALEADSYRPRPEGYFGQCDLCIELLGSEPLLGRVRELTPALVKRAPSPPKPEGRHSGRAEPRAPERKRRYGLREGVPIQDAAPRHM